jgi:hypothetical protein
MMPGSNRTASASQNHRPRLGEHDQADRLEQDIARWHGDR